MEGGLQGKWTLIRWRGLQGKWTLTRGVGGYKVSGH